MKDATPRARDPRSFILASASPRRRDLLGSAGFVFDVDASEVPETPRLGEGAVAYARRMARDKSEAVRRRRLAASDNRPVLAADTVVVLGGHILEKPRDRTEARAMLSALSGRTHRVVTAVCLCDGAAPTRTFEVATEVRFRMLDDEDIEAYLLTDEWRDKAGAYGIQGRAASLVLSVRGSYTNVVGLPLAETVEALKGVLGSGGGSEGCHGGS